MARRFYYRAVVERVIDGDTLVCVIDVGFASWTRQRLSLRGIDTPELKTGRGRKAKSFVQETLRDCPIVVVHTSTKDNHAGYLADLFYLPGSNNPHTVAESGRLLNQDMLDQSLAAKL